MSKVQTVGIKCYNCQVRWRIEISLSGNPVEVFATICECGAIIVGNFNYNKHLSHLKGTRIIAPQIAKNEKYLTNGHFEILDMQFEELQKLPLLELE